MGGPHSHTATCWNTRCVPGSLRSQPQGNSGRTSLTHCYMLEHTMCSWFLKVPATGKQYTVGGPHSHTATCWNTRCVPGSLRSQPQGNSGRTSLTHCYMLEHMMCSWFLKVPATGKQWADLTHTLLHAGTHDVFLVPSGPSHRETVGGPHSHTATCWNTRCVPGSLRSQPQGNSTQWADLTHTLQHAGTHGVFLGPGSRRVSKLCSYWHE